ncbi:MAG: class I SAM-dependent methyltransferase [Chloroflexaceae bacterium]|nr:class I SAM-dependent methyltransferase [Chloroflexaceae bacterium]NJO04425.1 class I SAM-dependent methyltransferase [Chloroflexaceae bacterium]
MQNPDEQPPSWQAQPLAPARSTTEAKARHAANRAAWNEGAAQYTAELVDTIDFLRTGGSNVHPIERANLARYGTLSAWCHTAIHLQCASGRDTLSLWNEGVRRVIGVDISDVHIENARQTSAALGATARWYCCDVLDTPQALDGTANLVYTGRGALCWLHDLDAWAAVVYRLLKPGAILHLFDDHPITWLFDLDATAPVLTGANYFHQNELSRGWAAGYLGDMGRPVEQHAPKYERVWPVSAVFQALYNAGLHIEQFGEHAEGYWNIFPNMAPEWYGRFPLTFSLVARRPVSRG